MSNYLLIKQQIKYIHTVAVLELINISTTASYTPNTILPDTNNRANLGVVPFQRAKTPSSLIIDVRHVNELL